PKTAPSRSRAPGAPRWFSRAPPPAPPPPPPPPPGPPSGRAVERAPRPGAGLRPAPAGAGPRTAGACTAGACTVGQRGAYLLGQHRDVVEAGLGTAERVVDRVEHASGSPDHAALAHALGPALAEGGRGLQVDHIHRAHLRRRGHQVVRQRRADRLALGVVADPLV